MAKYNSTGQNRHWLVIMCLGLLITVFGLQDCRAHEPAVVKMGAWKYLFGGPVKSTKNSPVEFLDEFELRGAHEKHPFRLNEVICDGDWGVVKGALQQTSGRCVAMKLATVEDFELELGLNAEGEGGWFILFGFTEGKGYGIYNVNMRSSGSPWFLSEFQRGKGLESTDQEFARYLCRGNEALTLKVISGQLSLQINRRMLLEEAELPNYQAGEIIIGTYDTNYGPKPLKIYGMRVRTTAGTEIE